MKIICPNCGKKYNYERFMGICPSCTKYTSFSCVQEQMSGHKPNAPDHNAFSEGKKSFVSQPTPTSTPTPTPVTPRHPKASPTLSLTNLIASIVILLLMITVVLAVFLYLIPNKVNTLIDFQDPSSATVKTISMDETIDIAGSNVTIKDVQLLGPEFAVAPEGWKYIYFTAEVTGSLYSSNYTTEVYINVDGVHLSPLYLFDIPEYHSGDYDRMERWSSLLITTNMNFPGETTLIFLIPEEIMNYSLLTYVYEEEDSFHMQGLVDIYELKASEVM